MDHVTLATFVRHKVCLLPNIRVVVRDFIVPKAQPSQPVSMHVIHDCSTARNDCLAAVDEGYCSTGGDELTRTEQSIAPIGHYGWSGECYKCPAGSYGDSEGLSSETCSGICAPGYYCPAGSISAQQIECGGAEFYCPGHNSHPFRVAEGFYTVRVLRKEIELQ